VGSPAKIMRYRFPEENMQKLLSIKWWNKDISELEKVKDLFQYEANDSLIDQLSALIL
jgi:hypothetical protein